MMPNGITGLERVNHCNKFKRGHAAVQALRYKPECRGFRPDGVIGIFH
jgi:hypothetical protein